MCSTPPADPRPTNAAVASSALPDAKIRKQALDTSQSFIVQAPAGSGKTELLTSRLLALLAQVEEPEHILAITFTKKAAAEMRTRVLDALNAAAHPTASQPTASQPTASQPSASQPAATQPTASQPTASQPTATNNTLSPHQQQRQTLAQKAYHQGQTKGWQLLELPQRLRIQTIDSLCSSIAHHAPFQGGFSSQPKVLERAELTYQQAATRALEVLRATTSPPGSLPQAAETFLDHLENNHNQAVQLLAQLLGCRDQWLGMVQAQTQSRNPTQQKSQWDAWQQKLNQTWAALLYQTLQTLHQALTKTNLGEALATQARHAAGVLQQGGDTTSPIVSLVDATTWPAPPALEDARNPTQAYQALSASLHRWQCWAKFLLTDKGTLRKPGGLNIKIGFLTKTAGGEEAQRRKEEMGGLLSELAEQHADAVQSLAQVHHYSAPPSGPAQSQILEASMRMAWHANDCLQRLFTQEDAVDYAHITQAALQVLTNAPFLPAFGQGGLQHLLVDEFQDTSHTQQQLFRLLTRHFGRHHSLFLVGDPMQAIYRFRAAEVAVFFNAVNHGLGHIALQFLQLQVNFRASFPLIEWVNRVFSALSANQQHSALDAIPYAPIQHPTSHPAHNPPGDNPQNPAVEYVCAHPTPDDTLGDNPVPDWAQALVMRLQTRMAAYQTEHNQAPSVAVLYRTRKHLAPFLQAMREGGVAYQGVDLQSLGACQEALDILSLVCALHLPHDALAWLAVLRAPWCGLVLSDLHLLCNPPQPTSAPLCVYEALQQPSVFNALSTDGQQRVKPVLETFKAAFALQHRLPLRTWVEGCWLALKGPAALQHQNPQAQAQALQSVQACFAQLEAPLQAAERPWPHAFAQRLEKIYAPNQASPSQLVQVMSIHKAKGSEFDLVVLPSLHYSSTNTDTPLLRWEQNPLAANQPNPFASTDLSQTVLMAARNIANPQALAGAQSTNLYAWLASREKQRQQNETLRLLYVAATRAKKYLLLGGEVKTEALERSDKGQPTNGSFLRMLWDADQADNICASCQAFNPTQPSPAQPSPVRQTSQAKPAEGSNLLWRFASSWPQQPIVYRSNLPTPTQAKRQSTSPDRGEEAAEGVHRSHFDGDGRARRAVGKEAHALLMHMANDGLKGWNAARVEALLPAIKASLLAQGVDVTRLAKAVQTVQRALNNALADTLCHWLLSTPGHTELPLWIDEHPHPPQRRVLDRSVVYDDQRWIVDYKLEGQAQENLQGPALESFVTERTAYHKKQLHAYGKAYQLLGEPLPIRLGVYFVLQQRLVAWDYSP